MSKHDFTQARFTGNWTCSKCGLLPLDSDDSQSPCNPPETYAALAQREYDEDMQEEALGSCGCTDYHMADCPTRTGG